MATATVSFTHAGQPLARTYVDEVGPFGGTTRMHITDDAGTVTIEVPDLISSFQRPGVDLRIYCQNAVVRVLNGATLPWPSMISVTKTVTGTQTIEIPDPGMGSKTFAILQQCLDVYDTVWRQFRPYNRAGRRRFPFRRGATWLETFNRVPRLELSHPDGSPATMAWVEPHCLTTGFPLVHIKDESLDGRLFGTATESPSLIPHELGHAFHFALMPQEVRIRVEVAYGSWLAGRLAANRPTSHNTVVRTDEFVALIEAAGLFSERFYFFSKLVRPDLSGRALRHAFVEDELRRPPQVPFPSIPTGHGQGRPNLPNPQLVGLWPGLASALRSEDGYTTVAGLTGSDVEGAVYGAIFLTLGQRPGLREAVGLYLDFGRMSAGMASGLPFTFGGFRTFVEGLGNATFAAAIAEAATTWGM